MCMVYSTSLGSSTSPTLLSLAYLGISNSALADLVRYFLNLNIYAVIGRYLCLMLSMVDLSWLIFDALANSLA